MNLILKRFYSTQTKIKFCMLYLRIGLDYVYRLNFKEEIQCLDY